MYGFMISQNDRPYTGLYFENEPQIPLKERGKAFRFSIASPSSDAKRTIATNLEYRSEQMTISTVAQIDFAPETYVVIGSDLFRIVSSNKKMIDSPQGAMVRKPTVETTMLLDKCNNPVGVSRI